MNILAGDQEALSRRFPSRATGGDLRPVRGHRLAPSPSGSPVLDGALAWIDATIEAEHDAGDHMMVFGRVSALEVAQEGAPLVFYRGGYGRFEL